MKFSILLLLVGCTTMSVEDREYLNAENAHRWEVCKQIYDRSGVYTMSRHSHQAGRTHRPFEIKDDLFDNGCAAILRRMGWE